jgi:Type II CAAX prenyl endopeptidase Rce1-like
MITFFLLMPTVAAVVYFILAAGHWAAALLYTLAKCAMFVGPWLMQRTMGKPWPGEARAPWRTMVMEGVVLGVVMGGIILYAGMGPLHGVLLQAAPAITTKLQDFQLTTPLNFMLAAIFISACHSGFEEWYWRHHMIGALLQKKGKKLPLWSAIALGGLAFSGHHIVVLWFYTGPVAGVLLGLVVGGAGVVWSCLRQRHASVMGAWIAHALCDVAIMYLGWYALSYTMAPPA